MGNNFFSFFSKKTFKPEHWEQLQTYLQLIPTAVCVLDDTGHIVYANPSVENIAGFKASSLPGTEIARYGITMKDVEELLSDRAPSKILRKISTPLVEFLWVSMRASHLPGSPYILLVLEEIPVLPESPSAVFSSSDRTRNLLQAILDNIPLGVYTRTAEGKMTYYNKQSQIVLGQTDSKYVNAPYPTQDTEIVQGYSKREQQILKEGKIQDYPKEEYIDQQGKRHFLHMIKVPLQQDGPEPLVLTIVEDITKRYEQEMEIATANNFLSAIIENAPVGLYVRTKSGRMLLSNKVSEHIFQDEDTQNEKGFSPHETTEQVEGYLNREAEVLASGKPLTIPEEPYQTMDGKTHLLRMIKVPVQSQENGGFVITMVEDITQRKAQEKQLQETLLLQQIILDNAPIALYAYAPDGKCLFFNQMTETLFGRQDVRRFEETFTEREREIFKGKHLVHIPEEEYIDAKGNKIITHLIKVPIYDKEGMPLMVLSIAEDITQKKQQEKEILRAKNFLQSIVDNLPVALSVKQKEGKYILWNKRSEDLFGIAAHEVIGKQDYRPGITREQLEFVLESEQRVFDSHREQNIAQELISTPKEGVKIMHTVKTPLYDNNGKPDYLLSVSEDITAKTKMEKQMREAAEKNSLLVENAREGIVILEDRKIIYANRATCHLLGFASVEETLGKRLADFILPSHQELAQDKYEAVINKLEGSNEPWQLYLQSQDKVMKEVEVTALVSKYLGRRIVLVFLRDVTLSNKTIRETRHEKETFKKVFERGLVPMFILNTKGYIQTMNKSARSLFHFTAGDRNFYRNIYIRPALSLEVRRSLSQGQAAQMNYVLDFDKAQQLFPGRIHGSGKLAIHLTFEPFNRRNSRNGQVLADYLVTVEPLDGLDPQRRSLEDTEF